MHPEHTDSYGAQGPLHLLVLISDSCPASCMPLLVSPVGVSPVSTFHGGTRGVRCPLGVSACGPERRAHCFLSVQALAFSNNQRRLPILGRPTTSKASVLAGFDRIFRWAPAAWAVGSACLTHLPRTRACALALPAVRVRPFTLHGRRQFAQGPQRPPVVIPGSCATSCMSLLHSPVECAQ